jgi:hypothetical protein
MATFTLTGTFGADFINTDTISLTASAGSVSPDTTTKSALAAGITITANNDVTITATCSSGNCNGTIKTIQTPLATGIAYDCNTKVWATAAFNCETGAVVLTAVDSTTTLSNVTPTTLTTNSGIQNVGFSFVDSNSSAYSNSGTTINNCTIAVNTNVATSILISGPAQGQAGTDITLTASDTCIPGTPTYTWGGSAIDGQTGTSKTFHEDAPGIYVYTVSATYNGVTYTDDHSVQFLGDVAVDVVHAGGGRGGGVAAYNTEEVTLRANTTNISSPSFQWYRKTTAPSGSAPVVDHPTNNNIIAGQTGRELKRTEVAGTNATYYYNCRVSGTNSVSGAAITPTADPNNWSINWTDRPSFTFNRLPSQSINHSDACTTTAGQVDLFTDSFVLNGVTRLYKTAAGSLSGFPGEGTFIATYNSIKYYAQVNGVGVVQGNWFACTSYNIETTAGDEGDSNGIIGPKNITSTVSLRFVNQANEEDPAINQYAWRVNNVPAGDNSQTFNTDSSRPTLGPNGTQDVLYGCTASFNDGRPDVVKTITIRWQNPFTLIVQAVKCGGSTARYVRISGATSLSYGNVYDLTAISTSSLQDGNGCYTITEYTGSQIDATATAIGQNNSMQPFSNCDDCNGVTAPPPPDFYYGLRQCGTLSEGYRTNNTTAQDNSLSTNDRIKDDSTGIYYIVINNNSTTGGLVSYSATGLTGCPDLTGGGSSAPRYYGIEKCDDGVLYRTQATNDSVTFQLNQIVETGSGGITFRVFDLDVGSTDYTEYSQGVSASSLTTCPLGTYTCNTHSDWVNVSYNSGTQAISVTPTRSTTTVHSYSPTTAATGQGTVAISFTFSDSNPAYTNANAQVACANSAIIDTGSAAVTYYARFVTCNEPAGTFVNVSSANPIDDTIVLSDGGECYSFTNNNLASPNSDLSNYTIYNSKATAALNCADCADVVNPPPPPPPEPVCYSVSATFSNVDPATDATAMEFLCTGRQRTVNMNGNGLSLSTQIYSDGNCTTLKSTPGYFADSSHYYYWSGVALTQIDFLGCQ